MRRTAGYWAVVAPVSLTGAPASAEAHGKPAGPCERLRPALKPLTDYDPVLARIDALVPGRGALADRVERFRARYVIPHDKIEAVTATMC